jgi:hypothetical protein
MIKNFLNNIMIITAFLVAVILISSSSISMTLKKTPEIEKIDLFEVEEISIGLAPQSGEIQIASNTKCPGLEKKSISEDCPLMYGFCAYPEEKMITINVCNCSGEEICDIWGGSNFLTSMTYGCDGVMYAVEYSTGILWGIDPFDCEMWSIGGGGTSLLSISYDPITNMMYGSGEDNYLYKINPLTGEQVQIGPFGGGVQYMIGIAFDAEGVLYGWDLGNDALWMIDPDTGEATLVGYLGVNLNYAQDGDIHRESNRLFLTAYLSGSEGALIECDLETGECEIVCYFWGGMEITGSCFLNSCEPPDHDVSLESIDCPESGYAIPEIPMQVTVKNKGANPETTDVTMQLDKYEEGPVLFEEDFSGAFPPNGWTTDYWNQSFTNEAGGESPEARVYNNDQINGGQYYDNYIMTPPIDATGWEKVTVAFRWAADLQYPLYCSFYVKYRKNETSEWNNISPWDNPLGENKEGDLYTIDCYGFGDDMGDGFQVIFIYYGYYGYYNYFYLDDVKITALNNIEDYNETIEDITLEPGEEKIVEFPTWAPNHWQDPDYENTWQDYLVKAWSLLEDEKPDNDFKIKLIDLYYPWMHDIEITSIDSPCEDGPGKTYPVQATIKNIGQYADCCIPINIEIGEVIVLDTLLTENSWVTVPPDGWYDEHKDLDPDYGWDKSDTSNSGGFSPEARLRYFNARPDHVLYSYPIDTSDYSVLRFEFKSYINHYSGSGLYALEAGYSTDKETWYALWHEEPGSSENYDVECAIEGGHETVYIGFWVTGNPYYFNYWYIDDISVKALDFVSEYSNSACQSDYLEPGETKTFEFDDWTPDYLQYETSGSKNYIVEAEINKAGDQNPDNDIASEYFTLDYWHDPALEKVTSPKGVKLQGDLCWDNGEPDGRSGLPGSMYSGYSNIIIDDFQNEEDWSVSGGHFRFLWNDAYGTGNLEKVTVYFFEETGNCDPSLDEYAEQEVTGFNEVLTGDYYFGRPEIAVDVEFDEVHLEPGVWWVGFQPEGINDDMAYLLTAEGYGCQVMADLPTQGYPRWSSSSYLWGTDYDLAWKLYCYTCSGPINAYIQPGTESIEAVAINYGTFEELDLTCNAQIWEFIFDPYGTKIYEDNITNIDLDEPLGGTLDLAFDVATFGHEGIYVLLLEMPGQEGRDDIPKNNKIRWVIGVDATNPVSSHTLCPPNPDGENGWYVDDVEVELQAYDPYVKNVASGVKEIKYRVNEGPVETIDGSYGDFLLTQADDGDDVLVEYWAIDYVGNEETPYNSFTIDMDQTDPKLDLTYEITGGNPYKGWDLLFTVTAEDKTSGMDRVEFFFNGIWQETIVGPGPTYEWDFTYHGGLNVVVTAFGFDIAGNMAFDEIDPVTTYNQNCQQQSQSSKSSYFLYKSQQNIFDIPGGGFR